jgi:hypothetical protein
MSTAAVGAVGQSLLPGQAAAPDGPVDLMLMFLMHHGFRRDLTAFVGASARTPVGDRTTWRALAGRWQRFADILHHHHSGEDAGMWPMLLARVDATADADGRRTLEAMEADHRGIDPLIESCTEGFARLARQADSDARSALEVRLVGARERLGQHLGREERDAMALVQRHLTQADWDRLTEEHFKPSYGPREMVYVASWCLHGLQGANLRAALAAGGAPLVIAWRLFGRRPFERIERVAFRYV